MSDAPSDQELVVHAPLPKSRDTEVDRRLRSIWLRCRELGAVKTIEATRLPGMLPEDLRSSRADGGVAALENGTADMQVVLRHAHDVLNLSLMFAAPDDTRTRRLRTGSAVPSGRVEFDRLWTEVAGDERGDSWGR